MLVALVLIVLILLIIAFGKKRKTLGDFGIIVMLIGTVLSIVISWAMGSSQNVVYYQSTGNVIQGTFIGKTIACNGTNDKIDVFKIKSNQVLTINTDQNRVEGSDWNGLKPSPGSQSLVKGRTYTISYRYSQLKDGLQTNKNYPRYQGIHVTGYVRTSTLFTNKSILFTNKQIKHLSNEPVITLAHLIKNSK